MVDVEAMKNDFIEQRKRHNEELRLKEKPLNENPRLLLITYKNGKGGMVIDQEQFDKFPKRKQDKIYKLADSIQLVEE